MAVDLTLVEFAGAAPLEVGATRVYSRALWTADWELHADLEVREVIFACAPSLPTATLEWRYGGALKQPGDTEFFEIFKRERFLRRYVKIEIDTHRDPDDDEAWITRTWYGLLEAESDQLHRARQISAGGRLYSQATGLQAFSCVGLEHLLADHVIASTQWSDSSGTVRTSLAAHTFNLGGRGNRTGLLPGDSHVFEGDLVGADAWSTREICRYLLRHATPVDSGGSRQIEFRIHADSETFLPAADAPELPQDGQTTYSLLDRLINRRRLLTWWLDVAAGEEEDDPEIVELHVASYSEREISSAITGGEPIPANPRQLALEFDTDPFTRASIQTSDVATYDKVIVRGAPRVSVGSFGPADGTLEPGWTAAQQTAYDLGASGGADYASVAKRERQRRNADARSAPALDEVYSRFIIPGDWDNRAGDGSGGAKLPMFVDDAGAELRIYLPEALLLEELPLYAGVDYSDNRIAAGLLDEPPRGERLAPLVVIQRPLTGRWVQIERAAEPWVEMTRKEENHLFSASVRVIPDAKAIKIRLTGQPQHALASDVFSPLAEDPKVGGYTYTGGKLIATLAIAEPRRLEAAWPEILDPTLEYVRTKILDAGDAYARIYVAPYTIVGVEAGTGDLQRSVGGVIDRPHDALEQLRSLAKLAWEWWGRPRKVLQLRTARLSPDVRLGDLVALVGDLGARGGHRARIDTPITQLRYSFPAGRPTPGAAEGPQLEITTAAGELDPLAASARPEPPPTAGAAALAAFFGAPPATPTR